MFNPRLPANVALQGVDLMAHGPDLLCPFEAVQLARARVLWINRSWFASVLDTAVGAIDFGSVRAWLLEEFAYAVPLSSDVDCDFLSARKIFFADRYGDDSLTPHGGSGRVGISGRFQVKGIGPTPLVGRHADWLHNHGCVWLEEGIREALVGQLIQKQFPVGGVPVIALIDTRLDARFTLDSPDRRRVLVVRPSFYRPAHMQRAPMFSPVVGDRLDQQTADARRARQMAQALGKDEFLVDFVEACALQASHAYFHRCFLGGMFSSNWTMDGRIADFGGITNVSNWDPLEVAPGLPRFGSETVEIEIALESICNRINALDGGQSKFSVLLDRFRRRISSSLEQISARSGLGGGGFSMSVDGRLSSRFGPALPGRFQFNRQAVQQIIWNRIADPDSLDEGSIEDLISDLMNSLSAE